jgi:hypothetical protein
MLLFAGDCRRVLRRRAFPSPMMFKDLIRDMLEQGEPVIVTLSNEEIRSLL